MRNSPDRQTGWLNDTSTRCGPGPWEYECTGRNNFPQKPFKSPYVCCEIFTNLLQSLFDYIQGLFTTLGSMCYLQPFRHWLFFREDNKEQNFAMQVIFVVVATLSRCKQPQNRNPEEN